MEKKRKRNMGLLLVLVALAGAVGTLARYGLATLVLRVCGEAFPWGTLVVNVLGCFLFGFVWVLGAEKFIIDPDMRTTLLTGFMGAFTTFSTFAFETGQQLREGQWLFAGLNITGQILLGLVGLFLGFALARLI